MPQDKTPTLRAKTSQPFKPTLASTRVAKSPITPRLAGSASSTPTAGQPARNGGHGIARAHTFSPDSLSAPSYPNLTQNVTPRSTVRLSRGDSASPAISTTLSPAPYIFEADGARRANGSASPLGTGPSRPKSVVGGHTTGRAPMVRSQTFAAPTTARHTPDITSGPARKFFHANDSRSPERTPVVKKPAVFFHANGVLEGGRSPQLSPSPPLSAVSARSSKSQFFHANGSRAEDNGDVPPLPSASVLTDKIQRLSPAERTQQSPAFFQPPGRTTKNIHLSYRKGASQIMKPALQQPSLVSAPVTPVLLSAPAIFPGSSDAKKEEHRRGSSLSSIDSGNTSRKPSATSRDIQSSRTSLEQATSPSSTKQLTRPVAFSPPTIQASSGYFDLPASPAAAIAVAAMNSPGRTLKQDVPQSPLLERTLSAEVVGTPQSPIKANLGPKDTEMAANARRERKVMDLEISNSSLLAINRQLEKEVRRQKTELRRFRRLSRTGRLSSLPESLVSRKGRPSTINEEDEDASLLDDQDDQDDFYDAEEDEEDVSEDESSVSGEDDMTPEALAAHDAKRMARDSKRLHLDLAKHRELLVDSQKMNQSLRRCMAWTEEMLKEGRKQLEHRVRVSDIRLGGRVLDPLDDMAGPDDGEGTDDERMSDTDDRPSDMENRETTRCEDRTALLIEDLTRDRGVPRSTAGFGFDSLTGLADELDAYIQTFARDDSSTSGGAEMFSRG